MCRLGCRLTASTLPFVLQECAACAVSGVLRCLAFTRACVGTLCTSATLQGLLGVQTAFSCVTVHRYGACNCVQGM